MHSRRLAFTKVPGGHGRKLYSFRVASAKPARLNESSSAVWLPEYFRRSREVELS